MMVRKKVHYATAGQSLMEVLVAIMVTSIGLMAIGLIIIDANTSMRQGLERTQATLLAREGLEAVRTIRNGTFNNIQPGTYGIQLVSGRWSFRPSPDIQDQFSRSIVIASIDNDTRQIQSTVTWTFTGNRTGSVSLTDYLTDWPQTGGTAGNLSFGISGASIGGVGNRNLLGMTLTNTGTSTITIDRMTVSWSNANPLQQILINGATVFTGSITSGTEANITNTNIAPAATVPITRIRFSASMVGAKFVIKFTMTDGSTNYVLVLQ